MWYQESICPLRVKDHKWCHSGYCQVLCLDCFFVTNLNYYTYKVICVCACGCLTNTQQLKSTSARI